MTVRQFPWASHAQGGPFVIYDVSEGLVYMDRQYVPLCLGPVGPLLAFRTFSYIFTLLRVHGTVKPVLQ